MSGDEDWRSRALCARLSDSTEVDVLFFGGRRQRWTRADLAEVREFCDRCPVQYECLGFALSVPAMHDTIGVFGGLLPQERATLRASDVRPYYSDDPWIGGDQWGKRARRKHRRAQAS